MNHNFFVDAADYVPLFKELPPVVKHTVISGTIRFAAGAAIGLAIGQNPLATGLLWAITNVASIAINELARTLSQELINNDPELGSIIGFIIGACSFFLVEIAFLINYLGLSSLNMVEYPVTDSALGCFNLIILMEIFFDFCVSIKTPFIELLKIDESYNNNNNNN